MTDYIIIAEEESAAGVDPEKILARLRAEGAGPVESLKALLSVTGMNLTEGKRVLFFSDTWADHRDHFDAAERALEAAIRLENWRDIRRERGVNRPG